MFFLGNKANAVEASLQSSRRRLLCLPRMCTVPRWAVVWPSTCRYPCSHVVIASPLPLVGTRGHWQASPTAAESSLRYMLGFRVPEKVSLLGCSAISNADVAKIRQSLTAKITSSNFSGAQ